MGIRIAVLISGNGTTLQNLIDKCASEQITGEIVCVISSRKEVFGLERAEKHEIPAKAMPRKSFDSEEAYHDAVWEEIRSHQADLVVLAGFMSLLHVPEDFTNKIMNVHPALIPAFCGKGMYGIHVHEAVIEYGVRITGVTVHFVDEHYDNGPIILQEAVPVFETDTPEVLADRIQAKEREMYPRAVQLFATGRLEVDGRKVKIS